MQTNDLNILSWEYLANLYDTCSFIQNTVEDSVTIHSDNESNNTVRYIFGALDISHFIKCGVCLW